MCLIKINHVAQYFCALYVDQGIALIPLRFASCLAGSLAACYRQTLLEQSMALGTESEFFQISQLLGSNSVRMLPM